MLSFQVPMQGFAAAKTNSDTLSIAASSKTALVLLDILLLFRGGPFPHPKNIKRRASNQIEPAGTLSPYWK